MLLSTRKRTGGLTCSFPQARENAKDAFQIARTIGTGTAIGTKFQHFPHIQVRKNLTSFRHMDQAKRNDLRGRKRGQALPRETDFPAARAHHTADGHVQRRLARTISAQHRNQRAFRHVQINAA